MHAMNNFDLTETTPLLRDRETDRASESQQSECCCPELCQLDHSN